MTDAEPQLNVLALNSGSSSLKFGLCVGSSRVENLLLGEAESIGGKSGNFHAEDLRGKTLLSETGPISSQSNLPHRKASRRRQNADTGRNRASNCPWGPKLRQHCLIDDAVLMQLEGAIAFAPLHNQLCRSSASHKSIFRGFRRRRVSTRHFTPTCRRLRMSFRSPSAEQERDRTPPPSE